MGARHKAVTSARSSAASHLRLAITSSSIDKNELTADHILQIDGEGNVLEAAAGLQLKHHYIFRSSAFAKPEPCCTPIQYGAIFFPTRNAREGGLSIEGYEMLKGLEGVSTHEHREWVPIIDNSQDMIGLAGSVEETLKQYPERTWISVAPARSVHLG